MDIVTSEFLKERTTLMGGLTAGRYSRERQVQEADA